MEKRAIIAVVLSMAAIIIYNFAFVAPQKETAKKEPTQIVAKKEIQVEKKREEPGEKKRPEPTPQEVKPIDIKGIIGEDQKGSEIFVETDLLKIVLTSKGGRISGVYMKKYKDKKGKPFNLVVEGPGGELPLSLKLYNPYATKIANEAIYSVKKGSLLLSKDNPEGSVTLFFSSPQGISITKNLIFYNDKYHMDVSIDIRGSDRYEVFWGPGLGTSKEAEDTYSYDGAVALINDKRLEFKAKKIEGRTTEAGEVKWIALQNKYFMTALIPKAKASFAVLDREAPAGINIGIGLKAKKEEALSLYVGPKEDLRLKKYGVGLEKVVDFGWFSFLSLPLLVALRFVYSLVGNYGFAIIIITVLIKIAFYPLTEKSFKSMQAMQKVQPKMKELQKIYKNDKQRLNSEIMSLYKQHNVNPASGCLPMLIQIPIFIALYEVLLYSIDVRQTPFIFWIQDLSAKDPYYVFPILMGASMYVQQKMTPSAGDPRFAQVMNFMPLIFTFMFLNFPVGLVIYWLVNNVLTIAQQYLIKKRAHKQKAKA